MIFKRTELLIGKEKMNVLQKTHILLFGLGGVGGQAFEALVRTGVGEISIVDFDTIDMTNCNRQILATQNTVGKYKTEVALERAKSINPNITIHHYTERVTKDNLLSFFEGKNYQYVIDAIDTVTAKLDIIQYAWEHQIPIISSMGTARKWNPELLEVSDITKTSVCPLARVIRKELKKRGVKHCKVVYSKEEAKCLQEDTLGSIAFVPSTAGLLLVGEVIKDICNL
ncbi:tRNA threonylcarbamoyladenosine dehydratase [Fusobacterium necrophorum subsp. funduliforme]|uniref:ThiF family protein n=5 Tax=Fusobacterium necrophorum TaxID=859 RepID=A0AAN3VXS7_9FUSO|nr:tRNA threonylcarbamoyladenosine dehydratase [Fusobacterium necrophorum]AVQ20190.1 tRNA threonylcarbamoyladenosine dehydratase [Fusobacterium necrophorum subsp. funduliforme]AYV93726.1 tRNA threonylcarbamoyladenosine dehydratase [Fusobacterium necrophorum subsp. funduliforme]AYV95895.1 tRNA threonylcarbamoyladenosine dehydratase [Fusobacterium necrophorum subsp. funduliforme]AYZ73806.1 tRNA threonylcarbamoyladenosine dehydratase [Fusobacterium necrophorum]AZW08188.1 tRNA threonylcarbamoylade